MSERITEESSFDVLGDVLDTLRFKGSIFFRSDLAAPWGMSLAKDGAPRFHIVLSGDCFIGASDHDAIKVSETDIIMLPNGTSHWIADKPGRTLINSDRAGKACELGNPLFQTGTITNRLMCGTVQFDQSASHPIIQSLPDVMHFPMLAVKGPIWSVVNLIDTEMRNQITTDGGIVDRLPEVLFLQLLNQYVHNNADATGFLAALGDKRVYRALSLIHRQLAYDWSLASLGEQAGMSRATLVRRFQDVVGVAPMAYITQWRIMKAHKLIVSSLASLEQIASTTGFASARTLTRAFKREYGCTPNELRRAQVDT